MAGDQGKPWFVMPVLVIAVIAISLAGAMTKLMTNAAPVSSAAWRLQATALVLLPGFLWDWWWLSPEQRKRVVSLNSLGILSASSVALALHFGLWVWSLLHTSLPHSLLLVSTPPIILAILSWLRCQALSCGENTGVIMGLVGVLIIAAFSGAEKDSEVTFAGDFASFLAACAFVVYMIAGSHLRAWMPLYLYVFPVTGGAAILLSLCCGFVDGNSRPGYVSGPFGWLNREFWFLVVGLALVPGFLGHTGFNAILKYCDPLIIAMAVTLEPVAGSIVGWLLRVSCAPGIPTCVGGAILVGGTIWVNYSSGKKSKQKAIQSAVASHPSEEESLLHPLTKEEDESPDQSQV